MSTWNPDAVKQAIDLEMIGEEGQPPPTYEGVTEEKLKAAAPYAAEALVRTVLYSENESMRFKAATYLLDKVLGKAPEGIATSEAKTTLEKFAGIVTANYVGDEDDDG